VKFEMLMNLRQRKEISDDGGGWNDDIVKVEKIGK